MSTDEVAVRPWPGPEAPSEAAIQQRFAAEGLRPYRWANGPGDTYAPHRHDYHKVIYVVQGAITFGLPDSGRQVALRAGDRLDLPPGIAHDAIVGPEGVVCLEAHQR